MWQFSAAAFFWITMAATGNVWFAVPACGLVLLAVLTNAVAEDDDTDTTETEE